MKYIMSFLSIVAVILILVFCGVKKEEQLLPENYLRIHIRANSNDQIDQAVKYKVKDAVIEALIPILSEVETKSQAKDILRENFGYVEQVSNNVLASNGFEYKASARFDKEYFPTRVYENITLPEGEYDSLILDLGSGEGNNWWCVVYPAFCFVQTKNVDNVVYISQIWDIIKNVTKKYKS